MKTSKTTSQPSKNPSSSTNTAGENVSVGKLKNDRDSDSESSESEENSERSDEESFATVKQRLLDGYWCNKCENWVDGPFTCPRCLEIERGIPRNDTDEEDDESNNGGVATKRTFDAYDIVDGYYRCYCGKKVKEDDICDCVVYRELELDKESRRASRKIYDEEMKKPPKRGWKRVVIRNPNVKKRLATYNGPKVEKSDKKTE